MKMYTHTYELFWVSKNGSEWSEFTMHTAPEKKQMHKKNISAIKNHVLLRDYRHQIQIIKPVKK